MVFAVLQPGRNAYAASIIVDSLLNTTSNADGVCTLREAIINANNDAATWANCAAGTGSDVISFSAAGTITLTSSLPNITDTDGLTINGGGMVTISGNNAFRIGTVNAGVPVTFQNITMTAGNGSNGDGGAIDNNGGTLTFDTVTFDANRTTGAGDNGGAIQNRNTGTLLITNSTFSANQASLAGDSDGGAILSNGGNVIITDSTFTANISSDDGGAIFVSAGVLSISGSLFENHNNTNIDNGGALYISGGTATITNTTFTNNRARSNGDDGGAVYITGAASSVSILASDFSNNTADLDGGAIRLANGNLTISGNTTFTNNLATRDGGAIYTSGAGVLTVSDTAFTTNRADDGGAIFYTATTLLTLTSVTFAGNLANGEADGDGGAITMNNANSSANITSSIFANNQANDDGGAIWNNSEPFTITDSIFDNNQALGGNGTSEGGAIYTSGNADNSSIRLSTFTNNSASSTLNQNVRGGAISNAGTPFTLANITFSGNSITKTAIGTGSAQGGAVYSNATSTIHNVTFNGNSASESGTGSADGGSVYRNAGVVTIANSILANATENGAPGNCGGTITDGGNNIHFNGADCGAGFTDIDPLLGGLTGNPPYFLLGIGSPAIDAGSNSICATATSTNNESQNNVTRPQPAAGVCDIGSFEYENLPPTDIALSNNAIDENQLARTLVGILTSTDPDDIIFTYSLVSTLACPGPDNASFQIGGVSSDELQSAAVFDHEITTNYTICVRTMDGVGNTYDEQFTVNVNDLDEIPPDVTVEQAAGQVDPTNVSPVNFTVTFSEPINAASFIDTDVTLGGTAGATSVIITEVAPNDSTTFELAVSGMTGSGTVIASLGVGVVTDPSGNGNNASTSTDNTVTYDIEYPVVVFGTNTVPDNSAILATGPIQITVEFSRDIKNDGSAGAANNPANYLLVENGANNIFDTLSCFGGLAADDTLIAIDSASYNNNGGSSPFVAMLNINGAVPLPVGSYQLFVCGTTSIEDLVGNELNGGTNDTIIAFTVISPQTSRLPATGFPQGQVTTLLAQPSELAYASYSDLWLEIPKLGVKTSIVGVPSTTDGWNVDWLGSYAGWLNGSAFPTWSGNSVITAHVWDALNRPGVFANLKNLKYGDQVIVHAFGQAYTYEIRENSLILSTSYSTVFKHEDKSWITLVTCEGYTSITGEYTNRRMVRAVLISVASK